MIEVFGDFWRYLNDGRATRACITTNSTKKKNGNIVMGRGIAYQAAMRYPRLPRTLGLQIELHGHHTIPILKTRNSELILLSFPTKRQWWAPASEALILRSAQELDKLAQEEPDEIFLLPRPGCSNGGLTWETVRPIISFLPDNVHVIDRRPL